MQFFYKNCVRARNSDSKYQQIPGARPDPMTIKLGSRLVHARTRLVNNGPPRLVNNGPPHLFNNGRVSILEMLFLSFNSNAQKYAQNQPNMHISRHECIPLGGNCNYTMLPKTYVLHTYKVHIFCAQNTYFYVFFQNFYRKQLHTFKSVSNLLCKIAGYKICKICIAYALKLLYKMQCLMQFHQFLTDFIRF